MDEKTENRRYAALVAAAIGSAALAAAVLYSSQRLGRARAKSKADMAAEKSAGDEARPPRHPDLHGSRLGKNNV